MVVVKVARRDSSSRATTLHGEHQPIHCPTVTSSSESRMTATSLMRCSCGISGRIMYRNISQSHGCFADRQQSHPSFTIWSKQDGLHSLKLSVQLNNIDRIQSIAHPARHYQKRYLSNKFTICTTRQRWPKYMILIASARSTMRHDNLPPTTCFWQQAIWHRFA